MENNSVDNMLRKIAKEIEISESSFKMAVSSYNAVGNYIGNNIKDDNIRCFPQGSFRLGTVIKPITEKDDYDIDLVVVLSNKLLSAKDIKTSVGKVLKNSDRYSKMLEEGKRCWKLEYSDDLNYHMDILPCVESETYSSDKKLKITHKEDENSEYEFRLSSPEAYYKWFEDKMRLEKEKRKQEYAIENQVDIQEVEEFKIKTTLQVAIMLLKRYRDIMFSNNPDDKPISIILTTILTELYTGKETVYELIKKFSLEYNKCLKKNENGKYVILNPVNSEENFADKWETYPSREKAFFEFITELRKDLVFNPILLETDTIGQAKLYKKMFGDVPVNKVYTEIGNSMREKREKGEMYLNSSGKLTTEKSNTKVKEHNFYGN